MSIDDIKKDVKLWIKGKGIPSNPSTRPYRLLVVDKFHDEFLEGEYTEKMEAELEVLHYKLNNKLAKILE